ncbi:MAG: Fic family protein [Clostridia bacterium]|nr:Fic family protein [Clostridia bacterium]
MRNIAELLHEQELLKSRINKMIHGSIEIRENNGKKYIYVHFRDEGISISKYAGEYSIELNNLILENNQIVKEYKKQLKEIKKELGFLQYTSKELNDQVKINIDLARKNMVESIYKQAKLEGVATTYSDTETIVNGGKVKDMTATDIAKVINLKHAWEFILSEGVISYQTNYAILCQINEIVEEGFSYTAGRIRSVPVAIGGSNYLPPLPYEPQIKEELNEMLSMDKSYNIAVELLLYVMKKQLYLDGNKRTAVIFANHYLISRGMGLIVIPAELVEEFKKLLIDYYEDKNEDIKEFLYNKCLTKLFE